MPLEIVTVPCLRDNYAYLLRDEATGRVGLVDAPEAAPIEAALEERGWGLDLILITHHHGDHIDGVERAAARLRREGGRGRGGRAAGCRRSTSRSRPATRWRSARASPRSSTCPGHTVGHVAYHFAEAGALFSADSLMVMGCGRLFEGTPEQMWASLSRLAALPDDTLVYSGHEYAESNARFALSVDGENAALRRARRGDRARCGRWARRRCRRGSTSSGRPTRSCGCRTPDFKARNGLEKLPDAQVFAEIRRRKDAF